MSLSSRFKKIIVLILFILVIPFFAFSETTFKRSFCEYSIVFPDVPKFKTSYIPNPFDEGDTEIHNANLILNGDIMLHASCFVNVSKKFLSGIIKETAIKLEKDRLKAAGWKYIHMSYAENKLGKITTSRSQLIANGEKGNIFRKVYYGDHSILYVQVSAPGSVDLINSKVVNDFLSSMRKN